MKYAVTIGPFVIRLRSLQDLPMSQQQAVLAHERGHVMRWHWLFRFFIPAHQKEYEADEYAAKSGHAAGLIWFLYDHEHPETATHPSSWDRISRLLN